MGTGGEGALEHLHRIDQECTFSQARERAKEHAWIRIVFWLMHHLPAGVQHTAIKGKYLTEQIRISVGPCEYVMQELTCPSPCIGFEPELFEGTLRTLRIGTPKDGSGGEAVLQTHLHLFQKRCNNLLREEMLHSPRVRQ